MDNYDIGIIGAGPAGYTAALHAAKQGLRVVLFEKDNIGGVCLNKGCIPTKSILHDSEVYKQIQNCSNNGIIAENIKFNYEKIIERKNKTINTLRKGIELALKNSKTKIVNSEAEIIDKNTIIVNDEKFYCNKIFCAIGSKPKEIKGLEFDHKFILSSDDILELDKLPKSILIVGSGAIGIEWARIFNNFNVQTTIVEVALHLLPIADSEVSKRIERIFKTEKIKFFTNTSIKEIENNNVLLSNNEVIKPDIILAATGRISNTTDKIDGVTYIGDASGEIQLAHYAIKQAIKETEGVQFDKNLIPSVVYGTPEIAWVGIKEQDLEGQKYEKSTILVSSLGKAHCDGQTDGFIKIISQNNNIIGAHIVCMEASSLIQQIIIAMQNNISINKLKEVCFPHPTYSEGIFEALLNF